MTGAAAARWLRDRPAWLLCLLLALPPAIALAPARPPTHDAQAASWRQLLAARTGGWWTPLWYGGSATAPYSVLASRLDAALGRNLATAGALLVAAGALGPLLAGTRRPRLGGAVGVAALAADALAGRTAFALGLAAGLWALVALRAAGRPGRSERPASAAGLLAVATALLSPVAALFLALVAAAAAAPDRARRTAAAAVVAGALLPVLAVAVTAGQPAGASAPARTVLPALVASLAAAACCTGAPRRAALASAALCAVSVPLAGPVGANTIRLALVGALPLAVACGSRPRSRPLAAGLLAVLLVMPVGDLVDSVGTAVDPASRPGLAGPLLPRLAAETRAGGLTEVVEPASHVTSRVLPEHGVMLARGWERHQDLALNRVLYAPRLGPAGYRGWLRRRGVTLVAVDPDVSPDPGARSEARLFADPPAYLVPAGSAGPWRLYRVAGARRVVGRVLPRWRPGLGAVRATLGTPGRQLLPLRFDRHLRLRLGPGAAGRLRPGRYGRAELDVTRPGTARIVYRPL